MSDPRSQDQQNAGKQLLAASITRRQEAQDATGNNPLQPPPRGTERHGATTPKETRGCH